jgi:hypothetical protein
MTYTQVRVHFKVDFCFLRMKLTKLRTVEWSERNESILPKSPEHTNRFEIQLIPAMRHRVRSSASLGRLRFTTVLCELGNMDQILGFLMLPQPECRR